MNYMERARRVCAKAASVCSARVQMHQPLHSRRGDEWLRTVSLDSGLYTREIHHSAELHRFYTNRFYKKCCTCCGRPNIVPVTRCGYCDGLLTEGDIHPVGRDVLRELAASRTCLYRRGTPLFGCADVRSSMVPGLYVGSSRSENFCRTPGFCCSQQASAPVRPKFDCSHCIEEYYRSFDFLIISYPFPIATVHLSAVMKGTAYDVKQLRPSHVPLLQRMQRQTITVVEGILQASLYLREDELLQARRSTCTDVADEFVHPGNLTRGEGSRFARKGSHNATREHDISSVARSGSRNQNQSSVRRNAEDSLALSTSVTSSSSHYKRRAILKKIVEKMKSCIILGFTYPCEYNQVNMHAIVPPIFNFNMLKAPFFFPLKRILEDLKESGSVQVNVREAGNNALGRDAILEEAREVDTSIRHLLESEASTLRRQ